MYFIDFIVFIPPRVIPFAFNAYFICESSFDNIGMKVNAMFIIKPISFGFIPNIFNGKHINSIAFASSIGENINVNVYVKLHTNTSRIAIKIAVFASDTKKFITAVNNIKKLKKYIFFSAFNLGTLNNSISIMFSNAIIDNII